MYIFVDHGKMVVEWMLISPRLEVLQTCDIYHHPQCQIQWFQNGSFHTSSPSRDHWGCTHVHPLDPGLKANKRIGAKNSTSERRLWPLGDKVKTEISMTSVSFLRCQRLSLYSHNLQILKDWISLSRVFSYSSLTPVSWNPCELAMRLSWRLEGESLQNWPTLPSQMMKTRAAPGSLIPSAFCSGNASIFWGVL